MKRNPHLARVSLAVCTALVPMLMAQQSAQPTVLDVRASGPKAFRVMHRPDTNQVSVDSKSTLGDFTSICNEVTGQFQIDPKHLEVSGGRFTMPVAAIRTGIGLRDKHLRGPDWLDAARHPEIVVSITRAENVRKESANTATMTLVGECSMHGVTREFRITATLTYLDESPQSARQGLGDMVSIRSEFELRYSDYNVKGSKMLGMKVQDVQRVRLSIFGATEP